MSTLREAGEKALAFMESRECHHESTHRGGVLWTICDDCGRKWADDEGGFVEYREPIPITDLRAALSAPAEQDGWQLVPVGLTEAMHVAGVRTIVHCTGNDDWPPRVWHAMLADAPRPAPAEPQGAEAPQEIKSLRDRIIEGELELDGTHPPTLMFLMAEHWKAVATEHYAKAKDYDRLKHELRLSRTAPAPRPAGGEPVAALIRHRSLQTEARIAHDGCDHYSDWSDWEPATVQHALAVTDPARNTHPLLWEARLLVDCQPQPAAQQEPLFWYRPRSDGLYEGPIHNAQIERARKESGGWVPLYTQAGERKPLTDEQVLPLMKQAGLASKKCDSKPVATIEKTQPKPAQKKGPQ